MEFHGSNAALGGEWVELTERRHAEALVEPSEEQPLFPRGVGGLVPIRTQKGNGNETVTYAFAFGEGSVELPVEKLAEEEPGEQAAEEELAAEVPGDETDGAGESEGAADGDAPAEDVPGDEADDEVFDDEPLPPLEVPEAQQPVLDALLDAVALVNRMLLQAAEVSGYAFGQVCAIQVGVTRQGVGFTRVEPSPMGREQVQGEVALSLHIETTDEMPGTPGSFGALVDYDAAGTPIRLAMLEYTEDDFVFRAAANIDEQTGELSIHKVERIDRAVHSERLMYKRGREENEIDPSCWEDRTHAVPRGREGRDGRRDDRGGRGGRWDDRRGGGYRGDRGGHYDRYDDRRGDRDGWRGDRDDDRRGGYQGDRYDRGGRYDDRGGYRDDRCGGRYDERGGRGGYRDDYRGDRYDRDDRRASRDDYRGGRSDDRRGGYQGDRGERYNRDDRGGYRGDRDGRCRDDRGPRRDY